MMPEPPKDFDRSQRRVFRKLVNTLLSRQVDPIARAPYLVEIVRIEKRLIDLRQAETAAEPGMLRIRASRAVTAAAGELRRLNEIAFRGAKQKSAIRVDECEPAADRAWRAFYWHGDRSCSHDELHRRYGEPGWSPLLFATHAEWRDWQNLFAEFVDKRIPEYRLEELRRRHGCAFDDMNPSSNGSKSAVSGRGREQSAA